MGEEGAIFIWKTPEEVVEARADKDLPTLTKDQVSELPEKSESGAQLTKSQQPKETLSQKSGAGPTKSVGSSRLSKGKK